MKKKMRNISEVIPAKPPLHWDILPENTEYKGKTYRIWPHNGRTYYCRPAALSM